jgi:hypothetical protein
LETLKHSISLSSSLPITPPTAHVNTLGHSQPCHFERDTNSWASPRPCLVALASAASGTDWAYKETCPGGRLPRFSSLGSNRCAGERQSRVLW